MEQYAIRTTYIIETDNDGTGIYEHINTRRTKVHYMIIYSIISVTDHRSSFVLNS